MTYKFNDLLPHDVFNDTRSFNRRLSSLSGDVHHLRAPRVSIHPFLNMPLQMPASPD